VPENRPHEVRLTFQAEDELRESYSYGACLLLRFQHRIFALFKDEENTPGVKYMAQQSERGKQSRSMTRCADVVRQERICGIGDL
jgi:hypothetical protein